MNQVLKFNRIKAQEPDYKAIESFVVSCIQMNIEAVSNAVSVLNQGQKEYAIESFVFKLIAAMMGEKDKKDIGEWINSGSIFVLKDKLVTGFKKSL